MSGLEIDWTRCDGHGVCTALLADRITNDEWGFPIISAPNVRPEDEKNVRRAIAACPSLALRLTSTPK